MPRCFCGVKANEVQTRADKTIFKCGVKKDYKNKIYGCNFLVFHSELAVFKTAFAKVAKKYGKTCDDVP